MSISLKNKTFFITGGSRGIGRAIALKLAQEKANIIIASKTDAPHPDLEGTIHSVAKEVEETGGKALPLAVDIRDETAIYEAVKKCVSKFGGIDGLINNASAIAVGETQNFPLKKYDLIQSVNARGTYACIQACLPHLIQSEIGRVITLSPPINLSPKWLGYAPAYMMSKYGMTLLTLGIGAEYHEKGLKTCTLWPATLIATDAIKVNFPDMYENTRQPEIVADAVSTVLKSGSGFTGKSYTDEQILKESGINNFDKYQNHNNKLLGDIFLDD
ncbi:MAG: short chain dehydrogenase [Alphaproteobacteria bacterium]|nr:short chain dehydrogenase [Alphaproteobacteria bacterium]|tara:strand:+ start:390 stop:1208 length:819 start_codon:yes stop_codon:yes gene_type:complete